MPNDFSRLYGIGKSTLMARQAELEMLADNLANINTPGFKQRRASFQAALDAETDGVARHGVQLSEAVRDFDQGPVETTGQTYDLAIDGAGFFTLQMPDGTTAYTRVGAFRPDSNGRLVNDRGARLMPNITIPQGTEGITIDAGGTVTASVNGVPQELGRLHLVRFHDPQGLIDLGNGVYRAAAASGPAQEGLPTQNGFGQIIPGALEMSNVNAAQEMTSMLRIERSYALGARALQVSDQMAAITNELQG